MTLGEERIYQSIWRAGIDQGVMDEGEASKRFSLGYDRLAHLVRLNEKSVRLALRCMIGKKMLEVVGPENSAGQTGRTYRIFSEAEIVRRQKSAGLDYIARKGRAVEFVQLIPTAGRTPTEGVTPGRNHLAATATGPRSSG